MESIELIGFLAGTLVAISLSPQVVKSWRTRSTKDIALSWTFMNLLGQILWIVYGAKVHSQSLVIMSSVTLVLTVFLIGLKLRFG